MREFTRVGDDDLEHSRKYRKTTLALLPLILSSLRVVAFSSLRERAELRAVAMGAVQSWPLPLHRKLSLSHSHNLAMEGATARVGGGKAMMGGCFCVPSQRP